MTAIPSLLAALGDPSYLVRDAASHALTVIGKPALPAIMATLRDGDPTARTAAVQTLARMGSIWPGSSKEVSDRDRERAQAARQAMRAALGDSSERVRSGASEALKGLGVRWFPI